MRSSAITDADETIIDPLTRSNRRTDPDARIPVMTAAAVLRHQRAVSPHHDAVLAVDLARDRANTADDIPVPGPNGDVLALA